VGGHLWGTQCSDSVWEADREGVLNRQEASDYTSLYFAKTVLHRLSLQIRWPLREGLEGGGKRRWGLHMQKSIHCATGGQGVGFHYGPARCRQA
jgi:hypothetical protein